MPSIQAQDIVNAAIQDSQVQTTNRTALYDYVDRTHQRILRESQWRFLLSDPETFITLPGVSSYTLVSGTAPAGSFQTNLNLTNFGNIAPGSVFNMSDFTQIEEDNDFATSRSYIVNRDGSLRTGPPRTYSNSITNPGTIFIKPAPDTNNLYYPVPETPVVTYAPQAGCTLPTRIYYGVVTFVDSLGGESVQCTIPFTIAVPAGNVVTVESPNPEVGGGIAGNQASYGFWNLYMGTSIGVYYPQNATPIPIGTNWAELITGAFTGSLPLPSTASVLPTTTLSIAVGGLLQSTAGPNPLYPWALVDSSGGWWEVLSSGGMITTTSITPGSAGVKPFNYVLLNDVGSVSSWKISVQTSGLLQTSLFSSPPTLVPANFNPPTTPTIQPLNAYVIQFRYYQTRVPIVNPTDILQIPYIYKDIVVAGVNYLANMYMDRAQGSPLSDKTRQWKADFEAGLAQIRRDIRINYRKTDFISPDVATQTVATNQQGIPTMGW